MKNHFLCLSAIVSIMFGALVIPSTASAIMLGQVMPPDFNGEVPYPAIRSDAPGDEEKASRLMRRQFEVTLNGFIESLQPREEAQEVFVEPTTRGNGYLCTEETRKRFLCSDPDREGCQYELYNVKICDY